MYTVGSVVNGAVFSYLMWTLIKERKAKLEYKSALERVEKDLDNVRHILLQKDKHITQMQSELQAEKSKSSDPNRSGSDRVLACSDLLSTSGCVEKDPYDEEDSPDNIVFTDLGNGKRKIRGGTFYKLVEKLTSEMVQDPKFVSAFLLTYRAFSTPVQLLDALIKRFDVPLPENATQEEAEKFRKGKQNHVRYMIWSVLKLWSDKHFSFDFEGDEELIKRYTDFIDNIIAKAMEAPARQLRNILQQKLNKEATTRLEIQRNVPEPLLPPSLDDFTLLDLEPLEVARQITLVEYDIYKKIQPQECLNQAWSKQNSSARAPHLVALMNRFNQASRWVVTTILDTEDIHFRSRVLNYFIQVALKLKEIHNFHGMMEVISGLQNSSVSRLKRTWQQIPPQSVQDFEQFNSVMLSNFQFLRQALDNSSLPCLPYIGIFLQDLTFIEDGNRNNLENGLINFEKNEMIAKVIVQIQQYQQKSFIFQVSAPLQQHLDQLIVGRILDEKQAFERSLELEPRESRS